MCVIIFLFYCKWLNYFQTIDIISNCRTRSDTVILNQLYCCVNCVSVTIKFIHSFIHCEVFIIDSFLLLQLWFVNIFHVYMKYLRSAELKVAKLSVNIILFGNSIIWKTEFIKVDKYIRKITQHYFRKLKLASRFLFCWITENVLTKIK